MGRHDRHIPFSKHNKAILAPEMTPKELKALAEAEALTRKLLARHMKHSTADDEKDR